MFYELKMELINMKVWEAIGNDLGEITDVNLIHKDGYSEIQYKSNGEQKVISMSNGFLKVLIQSFVYQFEEFTHWPKTYQASY
jgi:ribosomal 30S subunit maturation factor RimM